MSIQEWFDKRKEAQIERRSSEAKVENITFPGLWTKCVHCGAQLTNKDLEENLNVCPQCDYHFRLGARDRIKQLFDEGSFVEMYSDIRPTDPLDFVDTESYKDRIKEAVEKQILMMQLLPVSVKLKDTKLQQPLWILALWAVQWVVL